MSKLRFTFADGTYALGSVLEKEEPECSAKVYELLENGPVRLACYNTVSTGGFFAGFPRPPKEPVLAGTQVDGIGNHNKKIYDLEPGEICWTGWNFWFSYMPNTEPVGIGGPVTVVIDPEYMDAYVNGCNKIWENQYREHVLPVVVVEKEGK